MYDCKNLHTDDSSKRRRFYMINYASAAHLPYAHSRILTSVANTMKLGYSVAQHSLPSEYAQLPYMHSVNIRATLKSFYYFSSIRVSMCAFYALTLVHEHYYFDENIVNNFYICLCITLIYKYAMYIHKYICIFTCIFVNNNKCGH